MVLYIVGIVVALAGILGFFSESIIGMIETNTIQNIIYVVLGLLVLVSVMKGKAMLTKIIGIIFAILGILGLVISGDTVIGLVENTSVGNWFHLIVGVVVLLIAFMNKGGSGHSAPMDSGMNNQQMPPQQPQQPNNPQM